MEPDSLSSLTLITKIQSHLIGVLHSAFSVLQNTPAGLRQKQKQNLSLRHSHNSSAVFTYSTPFRFIYSI